MAQELAIDSLPCLTMCTLLLGCCLLCAGLFLTGCGGSGGKPDVAKFNDSGVAYLVESIPYNQTIKLTHGARHTWEVLTSYVNDAKVKIDLTAMYWDLLAANKADQQRNFTPAEFEALGANKGKHLLDALRAAAKRGVKLRALCGQGIASSDERNEIDKIKALYPQNVEVQVYVAGDWYDGGIMHQKLW